MPIVLLGQLQFMQIYEKKLKLRSLTIHVDDRVPSSATHIVDLSCSQRRRSLNQVPLCKICWSERVKSP